MSAPSKQDIRKSKALLHEVRKLFKRHRKKLEESARDDLSKAIQQLESALSDQKDLTDVHRQLEKVATKHLARFRKSTAREYFDSIAIAIFIALLLRTFVVEPFKIPTSSMIPTLKIGDHIFVNKLSYGLWLPFVSKKLRWGKGPDRGDVIVFVYPRDRSVDYIKRVVGVPGDTIELKDNIVHINGKPVGHKKTKRYTYNERGPVDPSNPTTSPLRWHKQSGRLYDENLRGVRFNVLQSEDELASNKYWTYDRWYAAAMSRWQNENPSTRGAKPEAWGPKIKPGYVFVMGDNRDFSSDSRVWGLVPMKNIKGRAILVWLSRNEKNEPIWKFWARYRWERTFTFIHR